MEDVCEGKKRKVLFTVCSPKIKFWAYLSCGNADIHNQTASENIETAARGGQAADVTCSVEFGGVLCELENRLKMEEKRDWSKKKGQ